MKTIAAVFVLAALVLALGSRSAGARSARLRLRHDDGLEIKEAREHPPAVPMQVHAKLGKPSKKAVARRRSRSRDAEAMAGPVRGIARRAAQAPR